MCALANMTGLLPDVRGMHEPSVDIADIPQVFSLAEEGGILQQHGVVELANSIGPNGRTMLEDPLRMGVFVVPIILLFRNVASYSTAAVDILLTT